MMSLGSALLVLLFAAAGIAADAPGARLDALATLPPLALAERLGGTSPDDLIVLGREAVRRLGTYRARLLKQERVDGKLLPPQTMEVIVQTSPRAQRLDYVEGPKAGRHVIWTQKRPTEMLVREAGILGITSLWIDLGGRLAHGDSNHNVTELGFGPLLDLVSSDLHKADAQGGHVRKNQGFDGSGCFWMEYTAPPGASGLYAQRTRLCIDAKLGLPVKIEVHDAHGFLERYEYTNIRPHQTIDPSLFEKV
ncbi:MAG TPA: DUF1571 domain-containing protein [Polyangia bacterium]|jgi:hypothetical protein